MLGEGDSVWLNDVTFQANHWISEQLIPNLAAYTTICPDFVQLYSVRLSCSILLNRAQSTHPFPALFIHMYSSIFEFLQ